MKQRTRFTKTAYLALIALGFVACGNGEEPEPEPKPVESNLYMSLLGDNSGLYRVSTETGRASRVDDGNGFFANNPMGGLAPSAQSGILFGIETFDMYAIELENATVEELGRGSVNQWGLAYDPQEHVVYASGNGYVTTRSPETGETLAVIVRPPNSPGIYGLAFDPLTRTLYGLSAHTTEQPQFNHIWELLYVMDVDVANPDWEPVARTGHLWTNNTGLAFDTDRRVLYATGNAADPGSLFEIDPTTAETRKVGPTGLADAGGGLAYVSNPQ